MTSLADRFLAEGEAKGEAIGIAKGKIEFLLTNLKIRFGELPEEIVESIRSYTDSIALQSLFEYSLRCQSLEEFKKELY